MPLLIERYRFVGGMSTSALVTPISEFPHGNRFHIGATVATIRLRSPFPDTVAKGAHVIDIHEADSIDQSEFFYPKRGYTIPLRCLIPIGSVNQLTAGRSLSRDAPGFRSARVMATCMAMGQDAELPLRSAFVAAGRSVRSTRRCCIQLIDQGAIVDPAEPAVPARIAN